VSTGRRENLLLGSGDTCTTDPSVPPEQNCPGLFNGSSTVVPGAVPPAPGQANNSSEFGGFRGELRCIQTDNVTGAPLGADALKGEAIIEGVDAAITGGPLLSEYNSINVLSGTGTPSDGVLELNGVEYNACPDAIDIIHYAPDADNLVATSIGADCTGDSCDVTTDFTIIPCRRDFENDTPIAFNVHFDAEDEFESHLTREVPFECWADVDLTTLGFSNVDAATFMRTRATSTGSGLCISGANTNQFCRADADCGTGGVCGPATGILAVVEEFHPTSRTLTDATLVGSAAANTHEVDSNGDGSLQRLGVCRVGRAQCASNADCAGGGLCRLAGTACTLDTQCAGTGDFCDLCMNDEITLVGQF